jgi:hypothetical protein
MFHQVVQVAAQPDFTVYVYFDDGAIRLYDVNPLLNQGVFAQISEPDAFISLCTVINDTLAWDVGGNGDPYRCIDIDPEQIYEHGKVVTDEPSWITPHNSCELTPKQP